MSGNNTQQKAPYAWYAAFAVAVVALAAALCFAAWQQLPGAGQAAGFQTQKISVTAQVDTDASLEVRDVRTVAFEEGTRVASWCFGTLDENCELHVNELSLTQIDGHGKAEASRQLEEQPLNTQWLQGGAPEEPCYALDAETETLYVFAGATDASGEEAFRISVEYTVENGAQAYDDTAELLWQFVAPGAAQCENVSVKVSLPVAKGAQAEAGANVFAWCHGPAGCTVKAADDGTVRCKTAQLQPGQQLEARICFPKEWLTHISATAESFHHGVSRLSTVIGEESVWHDEESAAAENLMKTELVWAALGLAAIAAALAVYAAVGRRRKPELTDRYLASTPAANLSAAVASRLWSWDRPSGWDFAAQVMDLLAEGLVRPDPQQPGRLGLSDPEAGDNLLANPAGEGGQGGESASGQGGACAQAALQALRLCASDAEVRLEDLPGILREAGPSQEAFNRWKQALDEEVRSQAFFEEAGVKWQKRLWVAAALFAVVALAACAATASVVPAACAVPAVLVLALVGNYLPRRTPDGNNVVARCKALRNWLRDQPTAEAPLESPSDWPRIAAYAPAFRLCDGAFAQRLAEEDGPFHTMPAAQKNLLAWLSAEGRTSVEELSALLLQMRVK